MKYLIYIFFLLVLNNGEVIADNWRQLYDSVDVLYKKGAYKDAIPICKEALKAAEEEFGTIDTTYQATARVYSDLLYYIADYNQSLDWARRDSSLCVALYTKKSAKYAEVLNNIAILYKKKAEYAAAEPLYREALVIIEDLFGKKHPDYIATMSNLAGLYNELGYLSNAEAIFKEMMFIIENYLDGTHPDKDIYLNNYSQLLTDMGRYAEAEVLQRESLDLTKKKTGERHPTTAIRLNNLAKLYRVAGNYSTAEKLYNEALDIIMEKLGDKHLYYASYLSNLAGLYQELGRLDKAGSIYKIVIDIIEKRLGKSHTRYASAVNNLANLYRAEGKLDLSLDLINEAIESIVVGLGKQHRSYARYLRNKALTYLMAGDYANAEHFLLEGADSAKSSIGINHPLYAEFYSSIALLRLNQGVSSSENRYFLAAEDYYLKAEKLIEASYSEIHPSNASVKFDLALLYYITNQSVKANDYFIKSLNITLENINRNFPSLSEKEKSQYYETLKKRFEMFNSFALNSNNKSMSVLEEIINYRLKTKALLFSSTKKVRDRIFLSGDSLLISKFKRWKAERDYLAKLYTLSLDEIKNQKINLDSLERYANNLEKELSETSELFAKQYEKDAVTWQDIAQKLDYKTAAIEIIRFRIFGKKPHKYNDNLQTYDITDSVVYAALIIKPDSKNKYSIETAILDNGKDMEDIYLRHYSRTVRFRINDNYSYDAFWGKIADKLEGIETVYISPDGLFNQINIATLRNPRTYSFLFEEKDIRLLTNLKDIIDFSSISTQHNIRNATLFGSPQFNTDTSKKQLISELKGAEIEVKEIDKKLSAKGWETKTFIGLQADEQTVKTIESPGILHIATHGLFLPKKQPNEANIEEFGDFQQDNPMLRSLLLFTGSENSLLSDTYRELNEEDGILTAYEAMNLSLDNTNLVVLSACETGLGDMQNGEGVYGMQRALMSAGAKSIIMSLWTVSDEATQKLMMQFYENITLGMKIRPAFNKAMLSMKDHYQDVYYWGAFVLAGE